MGRPQGYRSASTPWSEAKIEELKRLWAEGYSASTIAKELDIGVSRNGVIGKANRLRLSRHNETPKPGPPPREREARKAARIVLQAPPTVPEPPPEKPPEKLRMRRLQLLQLQHNHCRWPFGDPHGHPFYFCAADRNAGDT